MRILEHLIVAQQINLKYAYNIAAAQTADRDKVGVICKY